MNKTLAVVFSLEGPLLAERERRFFREADPLGFILFRRNCENQKQLRGLTDALRDALGRDCPVLIDQEGGRVQRLRPPHWRAYPPMKDLGDRAADDQDKALEDLRFIVMQMAEELIAAGINVNCAPVLDVLAPETDEAIGDRAFSEDPEIAARLGLSVCRNLLAAGITPVIKHLPGHGRAASDSHKTLPRVDASGAELEKDFHPFRALAGSDIAPGLWGMAAHVVYSAVDAIHPASVSQTVIQDVVRGAIGFDGFLLSDDLDMDALDSYGTVPARALAALGAGCDAALYCAGRLKDMEKIAETVPKLSARAAQRLQKASEFTKIPA